MFFIYAYTYIYWADRKSQHRIYKCDAVSFLADAANNVLTKSLGFSYLSDTPGDTQDTMSRLRCYLLEG